MRRAAVLVLILSVILDVIFGIVFAFAQQVSIWNGLYFATTTASTVGYGDITPRGWAAHLISVAIMLTVIPLFSAVFSLLTTTLTAAHADLKHAKLIAHLDLKHEELKLHVSEVHSGRPCSDTGVDSSAGSGERPAGTLYLGGVPGHDQPADAASDPEAAGS